ncbi:MAG: glycine cleavage T C-terminal barrel domain-containing protein [Pseudomonadota bacterium]|nr:glycine cleavage T C-terminal barrel domain-containing protein [Pseudomonadota bacterium]
MTSGGYSPTLERPIAMGYVEEAFSKIGTEVLLSVRGKYLPAKVADLPFVSPKYFRK